METEDRMTNDKLHLLLLSRTEYRIDMQDEYSPERDLKVQVSDRPENLYE